MKRDTQYYKMYEVLPKSFKADFDKAYIEFWRKRKMVPPQSDWNGKKNTKYNTTHEDEETSN
jgi:hypothetical protein